MTATSGHQAPWDSLRQAEAIRGIFGRSPVFRDTTLAEPCLGPGGEVIVDVSFNHQAPAALRVTAVSEEAAYAFLHRLAGLLVEMERPGTPPPRAPVTPAQLPGPPPAVSTLRNSMPPGGPKPSEVVTFANTRYS